jgi:putative acetyltransferase
MLTIRPERSDDYHAVRRVLQQAFGRAASEADLVDALRASSASVPDLCLVALDDEDVVGHLYFSRARLDSGDDVLALAPMAVVPERQGEGIGSHLLEDGLRRAMETAFPLIVVVGHATYYPRFGFVPADAYGIRAPWDVPAEAWMALRLPAYRPTVRGLVTYPQAFDAVT